MTKINLERKGRNVMSERRGRERETGRGSRNGGIEREVQREGTEKKRSGKTEDKVKQLMATFTLQGKRAQRLA